LGLVQSAQVEELLAPTAEENVAANQQMQAEQAAGLTYMIEELVAAIFCTFIEILYSCYHVMLWLLGSLVSACLFVLPNCSCFTTGA
jgi:hypothetical protein